jgi:hypothetical protein
LKHNQHYLLYFEKTAKYVTDRVHQQTTSGYGHYHNIYSDIDESTSVLGEQSSHILTFDSTLNDKNIDIRVEV